MQKKTMYLGLMGCAVARAAETVGGWSKPDADWHASSVLLWEADGCCMDGDSGAVKEQGSSAGEDWSTWMPTGAASKSEDAEGFNKCSPESGLE